MKMKIIRMPSAHLLTRTEIDFFVPVPSLGIGTLKNIVDGESIVVDDLNIKLLYNLGLLENLSFLNDENIFNLIEKYFKGKENKEIDTVLRALIKMIKFDSLDLVGFSLPNRNSLPLTLLLAYKVKEEYKTEIILGGQPFMGGCETGFLKKYPFIDYVHATDSLISFNKFFQYKKNKESTIEDLNKILGLVYLKDGEEIHTGSNQGSDKIDEIPPPRYDNNLLKLYASIPKSSPMFKNNFGRTLVLPYNFIKGCHYKCSFCGNSFNNSGTSYKSVDVVVNELKELISLYKINNFFFLNYAINLDDDYLESLCDAIIKNKLDINWSDSAKPKLINKKLIEKMREAGCILLSWGVESGSDTILKKMRKGHTSDEAARVLKYSHEAGIWNRIDILVGFPHETEKDFNDTLNFIKNNIEYIDNIMVFGYSLVQSDIYKNPKNYGIKIRDGEVTKKSFWDCIAFDEINGLVFKDKLKQIETRHKKVYDTFYKFKKGKILNDNDYAYNIFHLYNKYKNKKSVVENLQKL